MPTPKKKTKTPLLRDGLFYCQKCRKKIRESESHFKEVGIHILRLCIGCYYESNGEPAEKPEGKQIKNPNQRRSVKVFSENSL